MSRILLIATALACMACAAAAAIPDSTRVRQAFSGTIVSTYPDGRTGELWLTPGGTYTARGRRGDPSRGHWTVKGDALCLKQARPIPMLFSFCTPIPGAGLGDSWPAKAATGEAITVRLVKGRRTVTG